MKTMMNLVPHRNSQKSLLEFTKVKYTIKQQLALCTYLYTENEGNDEVSLPQKFPEELIEIDESIYHLNISSNLRIYLYTENEGNINDELGSSQKSTEKTYWN